MTLTQAQSDIRHRFLDIVARLGENGSAVDMDELLPATGLIDSTGLLELITWYEDHFSITLAQAEINIDNLGSIRSMASFALARRGEA
jgi:D-alanine--poly(phosphoribitol) ligase subunit 2